MIRRLLYRLTIRGKLVAMVMIVTTAALLLCIVSFVIWDSRSSAGMRSGS